MVKIIFSDVDGTLLNAQHEITPLTLETVHRLEEKGIPFVIVSARSPAGIETVLKRYDIHCPVIAFSGALMLDENRQVLGQNGMPVDDARRIIAFIDAELPEVAWNIFAMDQWLVRDRRDPRVAEEESVVGVRSQEGTIDSIAGSVVHKILCMCDPEQMPSAESRLKAAFPDYTIVRSAPMLLEIMAPQVSKAAAVREMCALYSIGLSDAAAFGDNYNDADMLETVGMGFLMANAPAELRERFAVHTEDHNHDGIYHALVRLQVLT